MGLLDPKNYTYFTSFANTRLEKIIKKKLFKYIRELTILLDSLSEKIK